MAESDNEIENENEGEDESQTESENGNDEQSQNENESMSQTESENENNDESQSQGESENENDDSSQTSSSTSSSPTISIATAMTITRIAPDWSRLSAALASHRESQPEREQEQAQETQVPRMRLRGGAGETPQAHSHVHFAALPPAHNAGAHGLLLRRQRTRQSQPFGIRSLCVRAGTRRVMSCARQRMNSVREKFGSWLHIRKFALHSRIGERKIWVRERFDKDRRRGTRRMDEVNMTVEEVQDDEEFGRI